MDCGFAVDVTRTLDEVAAALDCACYDILLLELTLPDGDGLDWLKQLRRSGKSMPAMVISGLDDLDRRIASFNGVADDYLSKPLSTVELIARSFWKVHLLPQQGSSELIDWRSRPAPCSFKSLMSCSSGNWLYASSFSLDNRSPTLKSGGSGQQVA